MNTGIFTSSAQPVLLNYIWTWSQMPAETFARPPHDPFHIKQSIRDHIDNAEGLVSINVPMTAIRHYLFKVKSAAGRLHTSLGLEPRLLSCDHLSGGAWGAAVERALAGKGLDEVGSLVSQKVIADLVTLHGLHEEALGHIRVWQGLIRQLGGVHDIHSTSEQPQELPPCLDRMQHFLLARIGLTRKAIDLGFLPIGKDATLLVTRQSLANAMGVFFDDGQRAEFDGLPLAVSLQTYLAV